MRLSREYMVGKLLEWNPRWNLDTVEGWSNDQLTAIYEKERLKTVQMILEGIA